MLKPKLTMATEHHVKHNRHHPESHTDATETISREDRDKAPKKKVDGTAMLDLDVGEMTADWMAMSEEKGGTPKAWADKNVGVRWEFSKHQQDLIYGLIDAVWDKE